MDFNQIKSNVSLKLYIDVTVHFLDLKKPYNKREWKKTFVKYEKSMIVHFRSNLPEKLPLISTCKLDKILDSVQVPQQRLHNWNCQYWEQHLWICEEVSVPEIYNGSVKGKFSPWERHTRQDRARLPEGSFPAVPSQQGYSSHRQVCNVEKCEKYFIFRLGVRGRWRVQYQCRHQGPAQR